MGEDLTIGRRLAHAWNAFKSQSEAKEEEFSVSGGFASSMGYRERRPRPFTDRTLLGSIYKTISVDAASIVLMHSRLDKQDRFLEPINSGLNECLTVEANIDQAARHFRQDIYQTLCEEGVLAIVPVDTSLNPGKTGGFDILTVRVGRIVAWYPRHVKVNLYDDRTGNREDILVEKRVCAIVENPHYTVMNEPNSTLQRLVRTLAFLDQIDEKNASGKLDVFIQLPYVVKSEHKRSQAARRLEDIEEQLNGSKHGIAYIDGTEKVVQLNRPSENNMLARVEYLSGLLHTQLGLTPSVMNGSATEEEMLNYMARTVEPMVDAVVEAMIRSFLTKTARTQKQTIMYFRDAFRLVTMENFAEIADKLARNEVVSANELRSFIGLRPSTEPKADQLINSNMPVEDTGVGAPPNGGLSLEKSSGEPSSGDPVMDEAFGHIEAALDQVFEDLDIEEDEVEDES